MEHYSCGNVHHLLKSAKSVREINRIHTKIKIATGTYVLQTNRAAFNQNKVDSTCLVCRKGEETMQHFLLECSELHMIRNSIMNSVLEACSSLCSQDSDTDTLLELIIDWVTGHFGPKQFRPMSISAHNQIGLYNFGPQV